MEDLIAVTRVNGERTVVNLRHVQYLTETVRTEGAKTLIYFDHAGKALGVRETLDELFDEDASLSEGEANGGRPLSEAEKKFMNWLDGAGSLGKE